MSGWRGSIGQHGWLLAVWLAAAPAVASGGELQAAYEVSWAGIAVGRVETSLDGGAVDDAGYRLSWQGTTVGLAQSLFPFASAGSSEGRRVDGRILSGRFAGETRWSDGGSRWLVTFAADGHAGRIELAPDSRAAREPVPAALQLAPDPMALLLQAVISWVNPHHPVAPFFDAFTRPMLAPLRKVVPLKANLARYDAWITGIRRVEAPTRANAPLISFDEGFGLVKINPIAPWSDEVMQDYIDTNGVLVNPLVDEGYPSIGCAPCTAKPEPGSDKRSGRWAGRGFAHAGWDARRDAGSTFATLAVTTVAIAATARIGVSGAARAARQQCRGEGPDTEPAGAPPRGGSSCNQRWDILHAGRSILKKTAFDFQFCRW